MFKSRRCRPLEEGEARAVECEDELEMEFLHETREYSLKWPDAKLTSVLRGQRLTEHIPTLPCEADEAWEPLALDLEARALRETITPGLATGACEHLLTLPEPWLEALRCRHGPLWSPSLELQYEAAALRLEREAVAAWTAATAAARSVTTVRRAVEAVAGDLGPIHEDALLSLWVAGRDEAAGPGRSWGRPLLAALHSSVPEDEYFVDPAVEPAGVVYRKEQRQRRQREEEQRRRAQGAQDKARRQRPVRRESVDEDDVVPSQAAVPSASPVDDDGDKWLLPYDPCLVDWAAVSAQSRTNDDRKRVDPLVPYRALLPLLGVAVRPVGWELDDLIDEMQAVRCVL